MVPWWEVVQMAARKKIKVAIRYPGESRKEELLTDMKF